MNKRNLILGAALASLVAAGTTLKASNAYANDDQHKEGEKNSCKGKDKASCNAKKKAVHKGEKDKNACAGKNGCASKTEEKKAE